MGLVHGTLFSPRLIAARLNALFRDSTRQFRISDRSLTRFDSKSRIFEVLQNEGTVYRLTIDFYDPQGRFDDSFLLD